ncbi:MAG: hypothetical protein ACKN9U_17160, partial [Pirellulaceae bacterium]
LSSLECGFRCHEDRAPSREMDAIGKTVSVEDAKNLHAIPLSFSEQSKDCLAILPIRRRSLALLAAMRL